ncbi:hypothetical protein [Methylorubrum suomiense]|uniref:Uncharacterized protein n=1 Tax=Methylorubrum suomiense TaxID=144191 RepID=A0ABQ4V1M8_9HYPH|nr:hypothetical protein [Methylorubrum suomiense]GJE77252.1 hypothetical protein BGCPKDLD_3855 [Methylorubrum suomiense]
MQKLLPLTDQVRAALREDRTSDQVKALIEELGLDRERIKSDLIAAKAKAVDPMTGDDEADAARRLHHDLGFEEERAVSSIAQLKLRLSAIETAEDEERRRIAYEAAEVERDECVRLVREEYPKLADALVVLLQRVVASNEQIRRADPPADKPRLQPAEWIVREANDIHYGQLIDNVILPGMHRDAAMKWFRRVAECRNN